MNKIRPFGGLLNISILCLIVFMFMAIFVKEDLMERFDLAVIQFVQGLESESLTKIMFVFTKIGSFPFVITIFFMSSLFLYFVLHHRSELVLYGGLLIVTQIANQLLKSFFQRTRPEFHRLVEIGGYSFPSGHAMSAFTVYTILAFLFWRHIRTAFGRFLLLAVSILFILLIGISRIYLGVHFPSDIIGGYSMSAFLCGIGIWNFLKVRANPEKQYKVS
ncbi:phosphatase PAP2 family protein [Bacillus andreraoultii]|uniref:phosphatase PAP2 family protein n=1 Tax=Bacillus andreraoultii TaxID=1499685 RepID=UPI0005A85238|nr:phosphatase PAP2 family protein [Bacillus andreraoultii]